MKITFIIFIITVLSLHCYGEENSDGKRITSSYSYSFEYDDSDHGNFGHKIEVKDGNSKVNVRSENAKKFNSAVASKPGNPYLPQKNSLDLEKPKGDVAYTSATERSTVTSPLKNIQHTSPQIPVQSQKNTAFDSALQKYPHEQLKILLSQNKNPFLPLDPKDSINKYISKYVLPQTVQPSSVSQPQSNVAYSPQVSNNNYLNQYHTQTYSQAPIVSSDIKSQYPVNYFSPSVSQQNNVAPQAYYSAQVPKSYPQPSTYEYIQQNNIPSKQTHLQSTTANQGSVQYIYVPQTSPQTTSHATLPSNSFVLPQSYNTPHTSNPIQFLQQHNPSTKLQYQPSTYTQAGQVTYNLPKTSDYVLYNPTSQPVQATYYNNPQHTSSVPQSAIDGYKQYVSVPSNYDYHNNQAASNQVSQSSYKNGYGNTVTNHPSNQYGQNTASYKPEHQTTSQISSQNFAQYIPTSNQQISPVGYKPSQTVIQSPNTAHYGSGLPTSPAASITTQDVSKYNIIGSNPGHNLFSGLISSPNYGSVPSIPSSHYQHVNIPTNGNNLVQGSHTVPQITNVASHGTNYKPVVENREPTTIQYQTANTAHQPLNNAHNNYIIPNQHSFILNQVSNVQAYDNKNGQYAIDIRQGTNPSGSSQVMVQTNYNLGSENLQNHPHRSVPVSAASDNSNIKYVYVPSYVPNTSETANHGK